MEHDTLGVSGVVTATMSATGTRANPLYSGSFAFSNASFGSFRAPFMDGIIDYRNRRLNGEVQLWRAGAPGAERPPPPPPAPPPRPPPPPPLPGTLPAATPAT